jgi:Peptidase C13 family
MALAGLSEKMNKDEDVLILYSTSHGAPGKGIVFKDGDTAAGYAAPALLKHWMDDLGIERRLLMISACYSGQFVPVLESEQSVIVTAASASRPSFGCDPGNDWTFFGDALINNALRKNQSMDAATGEAFGLIRSWEDAFSVRYSEPQVFIGAKAAKGWLTELESLIPAEATKPVGKPAAGKLTKKVE